MVSTHNFLKKKRNGTSSWLQAGFDAECKVFLLAMASVEGPKYFAEEVGACCAFFWELGALTEFQGLV